MTSNTLEEMTRTTIAAIACCAVVAAAPAARADLDGGRDKFVHGDYAGAREELARVPARDRAAASALLGRIELRTGDYAAAERRARALARSGRPAVAASGRALLAEVQLATGRYADAIALLEKATAAAPDHLRLRYLLAMAYRSVGRLDDAAKRWEAFFADYDAGKLKLDVAEHAMYLGFAARYTGAYEDANDAFREAVTADPKLLDANIAWGELFLDKYAADYAEQSFDDVLKIDAHHPDAHAGMARVKIEQSYDVAAAQRHIREALAVNPHHAGALRVRAMLEIDANEWDAAIATLDSLFAVNPNDLEARALRAAIDWLRDDAAGYERERAKVFAVNPKFGAFYHIVARSAEREHRYREAIALEQQAVSVDPHDYSAMQSIGSGYLRLGDEAKGLEWLRRAWEGDQYNVRTYNLLELFEQVIPKEYEFAKSKHFVIRYHRDERKLLDRYVQPLLERAYADMVARYRFHPTTPIQIELFRNPEHYSVRTVGLPNLGALGVCFGRVITATSPSAGSINWAMVLWHELGHVFAIQMSKSRVPRWYTEGLSEYETVIARPEWRRENDVDVWGALEAGTLPSVVDLNHGFLKPTVEQVVVAYHTSSLAIEFIAKTYGFDRIVRGLELYGAGFDTAQVIEKITGLSVSEFDEAFRAYLRKRLAHYRGTFRLPTVGFDDVTALEQAVAAAPKDAMAHARLGIGRFYAGDADGARAAMTDALALDPDNPYALYVLGELALRERNFGMAKRRYEQLLAAGHDGYEPRVRLGYLAIQEGDVAAAERQLAAAKRLDPERSDPYLLLAEMYEDKGRVDDALAEYERYVVIEQMQYAPIKHLVDAYAKKRAWAKVRTFGEMAVNINPFDGELLLALGRAYLETNAARRSAFTYESALLARPPLRRPALAHIGRARAYRALGDRKRARAAVRAALDLEPRNRDALDLQRELAGTRGRRGRARRGR
ncbi:MAG: hypothetical protein D6689_02395 [Deltaproteobacteria bacterium]|nr:MAG: hypothetical protein D6689_02395 [Deltaproteobacteria bacterium]